MAEEVISLSDVDNIKTADSIIENLKSYVAMPLIISIVVFEKL